MRNEEKPARDTRLRTWQEALGIPDATGRALLARYFRSSRVGLALYAVGASFLSFLVLPTLWLLQQIFDKAIPEKSTLLLVEIAAAIVVLRLAASALTIALRRHVVRIIKSAVSKLRQDLLAGAYLTPPEHHSRTDLDRLQSRIVQDSERIDVACNAMLSAMLPAALSCLMLLGLLSYLNWKLMLVGVITLPLVWWGSYAARRKLQIEVAAFQSAFDRFSKGVSFAIRHLDLTRAHGYETEELARQGQTVGELNRHGVNMSMAYALHGQLQTTVASAAGIALLVLGGIEVIDGRMTIGSLAAFYFGAGMLFTVVGTWLGGAADVAGGTRAMANVAELLAAETPPAYTGERRIAFEGAFALEGVTFEYDDVPTLRGIDIEIPAGARVAIVGPNGSGKSTLLNILVGIVRPKAGRALADGLPYDQLDMTSLRRQIGIVGQKPAFFYGTVRENITYGAPDATDGQIDDAVRMAGASRIVAALPNGYETQIGQNGVTLSGGECQRLAIARALLRKPRALILDEPTNHLDVESVIDLVTTLKKLPHAPTVILVSHDPRVIDFAEITYALEDGRLRAHEHQFSQSRRA